MDRSPRILVLLLLLLTVALPGCLRRRMMIRSNPPGAMAYVDNQQIGTTPCTTDFVYYGTREIRLVKPGYETLTVNQPIPAPWYEIPPLDFVTENLVPREVQDYRTLSYNLMPQVIVPTEQLLGRAEQLRQATAQGSVLPATATTPTPMMGVPTPTVVAPQPGGGELIAPGIPIAPSPTTMQPQGTPQSVAPYGTGPGPQLVPSN